MRPHLIQYQWIVKRKWTPKSMAALRRRRRRRLARRKISI